VFFFPTFIFCFIPSLFYAFFVLKQKNTLLAWYALKIKRLKKQLLWLAFFESMPRSPTSAVFKRKASSAFKEGKASDPSFYFKEIKKRCSPSDWLPSS